MSPSVVSIELKCTMQKHFSLAAVVYLPAAYIPATRRLPLLAPQASRFGRLSGSGRVQGLPRAQFSLGLQPVVQRLSIRTALLFPDEIRAFGDLELRIEVHDISPLQ
jgi:hypothetical protein